MNRLIACALPLLWLAVPDLLAQESATRTLPAATKPPVKTAAAPAVAAPAAAAPGKPVEKDPIKAAVGGNLLAPTGQAVTTEIYADEAFFDSEKYIGTFSGRVIVKDPRFNIQADKLTVNMAKGEERGLDKAIAEGNVGVIRETPGENGGPPVRSVGRSDKAVYTAKDGNVELSGTPRVQSGMNTHVATSPDTVMLINQAGQLTTKGPSRTDIRQEPKIEPTPKP